jgi:hypothetical protein
MIWIFGMILHCVTAYIVSYFIRRKKMKETSGFYYDVEAQHQSFLFMLAPVVIPFELILIMCQWLITRG